MPNSLSKHEPAGLPDGDVSLEEMARRRAVLERDRAAALIMEPGDPRFAGPGAVAAAAAPAMGAALQEAAEGGDAQEAIKAGAKQAGANMAVQALWKVVWGDLTGLSTIALTILAFYTGMKGWPGWQKFALIALVFFWTAVYLTVITLVIFMTCMMETSCRVELGIEALSDLFGWFGNVLNSMGI